MSQFFDALEAGAKATIDSLGPGEYTAAGRPVGCAHGGEPRFALRSVPGQEVGTIGLFGGYALRCEACSHVMLFADAPTRA